METACEVDLKEEKVADELAFEEMFLEMLDVYDTILPKQGQYLEGQILRIDSDAIYIDVGAKRDAIVPYKELAQLDESWLKTIERGDEVPLFVMYTPLDDEPLLVSLERGLEQQDWLRAEQDMANDAIVTLKVIGYNKGGLLVKYGRLTGFVPHSHIPDLRRLHPDQHQQVKNELVKQELPLKTIEIDRANQRLVFSLKKARKALAAQKVQELEPGDVLSGKVVHMTDYGAFVDIGTIEGLLHISNISWEHLDHPSDALSIGETVEVQIDSIDPKRKRISLNRKAVLPNPWLDFANEQQIGDLVSGQITAVRDFGAFVHLGNGIDGLIPAHEIDKAAAATPADVLHDGDNVLVRIISLDAAQERVGLSLRAVSPQEEMTWLAQQQETETTENLTDHA